ncbi:LysR substrate-binding domain-containing protein [Mesorhizobium sp. SB112]|uniref:LysR family transcriptional regulator n=1 Tax=Mesorhizobium sp. SB112 TaxID=3151853 RepID=UPI003262E085
MDIKPTEFAIISKSRVPYLGGLRSFYSVAKFGSFSAAAEALAVAPSAVNRQVAALEERLGERLFDRGRGRGGIQLTAVGTVLFSRMLSVMNEITVADEEINLLRGLRRGHIRLGVNEVVATQILPKILEGIHSLHPDLTFRITVQNSPIIVQKLREGEIDIGLGYNITQQPDISFHDVANHNSYVISAAGDELSTYSKLTLHDLVGRRFIFPDTSMALRQTLDVAIQRLGLAFEPFIETDNFTLLRKLVATGLGISIVTGHLNPLLDEGLAYVKIDDPAFRFGTLCCCTLMGRTVSSASQLFIDTARNAMDSLADA